MYKPLISPHSNIRFYTLMNSHKPNMFSLLSPLVIDLKVGGDVSILKMILRYSNNFICCLDTIRETFQLMMNSVAEKA